MAIIESSNPFKKPRSFAGYLYIPISISLSLSLLLSGYTYDAEQQLPRSICDSNFSTDLRTYIHHEARCSSSSGRALPLKNERERRSARCRCTYAIESCVFFWDWERERERHKEWNCSELWDKLWFFLAAVIVESEISLCLRWAWIAKVELFLTDEVKRFWIDIIDEKVMMMWV